ncbi:MULTISPECIES: helix-turn-helix domain-containing protein [Vibrio]|uniref:HTH cro/C1-type domain-containing protein n=2 Tax=Vibrio TaxID=662 RepID=A0A1M5ZMD2_9VIBR|nr:MULTISPECIES: helix-turn-helix transcriptional regulator [Vibrio]SHI25400.1 hypothetical protein VA7868_02942 [Vibrio aerogenes CECT 7868]SHO54465.1 hypothetical protein VQ7734_00179 [Vibrio quintilis]
MITSLELLDMLKAEADLHSDYAVAKFLNVSHQAVSRWRNGKVMSEETATKIARILEIDEDVIILSNIVEKQKNEKAKAALLKLMAS